MLGLQTSATRIAATALTLGLLPGCSSGLSHTIPDAQVAMLGGEYAANVDAARREARDAERTFRDVNANVNRSRKAVKAADTAAASASSAVDRAEQSIDKLEDALDRELDKAADDRDAAIKAAESKYDKDVAAIKSKYGSETKDARQQLAKLSKVAGAEEARTAYQEALLEERETSRAMHEAEMWAKRAQLELTKLEMLVKSKGQKGPEVTERLLDFKEQLAERERTLLSAQKAHAGKRGAREKARKALNTKLAKANLPLVEDPDPPAAPLPVAPPAPTRTEADPPAAAPAAPANPTP